jgi:hypothetical protein
MAACPISINPGISGRRPIALTQRRLEANRRNAARSTGPRTAQGKARVAHNAVKHGFFLAQQRWTPGQRRDFEEIRAGLRDDFKPNGELEESCIATMAESYVRMAAMLHYENIAALKYHQQQDREMAERIAAAAPAQAARLRADREKLRRAGLWRPTIPGPRQARAIIRYGGSLDRAIRRAASELDGLKSIRIGGFSLTPKVQKQTHYSASPKSGPEVLRRAYAQRFDVSASPNSGATDADGSRMRPAQHPKAQKQTHFEASGSIQANAKTNPLSSMFTGNPHERRRAKALARQRR